MIEVPVRGSDRPALVDDADYLSVSEFRWSLFTTHAGNEYARYQRWFMHCRLTGYPQTDHRDGDGLNNRRSNLRACTSAQNAANRRPIGGRSRFKGVRLHGARWQAQLGIQGPSERVRLYLGTFLTEEDAARAYDTAALEHFGEFALTNESLGLYELAVV